MKRIALCHGTGEIGTTAEEFEYAKAAYSDDICTNPVVVFRLQDFKRPNPDDSAHHMLCIRGQIDTETPTLIFIQNTMSGTRFHLVCLSHVSGAE